MFSFFRAGKVMRCTIFAVRERCKCAHTLGCIDFMGFINQLHHNNSNHHSGCVKWSRWLETGIGNHIFTHVFLQFCYGTVDLFIVIDFFQTIVGHGYSDIFKFCIWYVQCTWIMHKKSLDLWRRAIDSIIRKFISQVVVVLMERFFKFLPDAINYIFWVHPICALISSLFKLGDSIRFQSKRKLILSLRIATEIQFFGTIFFKLIFSSGAWNLAFCQIFCLWSLLAYLFMLYWSSSSVVDSEWSNTQ